MISSALPRLARTVRPAASQGWLNATALGAAATAYQSGDVTGRVVGGAASIGGRVGGAYLGSRSGAATMGVLGFGPGIPAAVVAGKTGLALLGGALTAGG